MSDYDGFLDFFGEEEEKPKEEIVVDIKKNVPQLFDWLNSITYDKNELIKDQEYPPDQLEKAYIPFPINRGISMGMDNILLANEMNRLWLLNNDAQYRYYLHKIRKAKRRNTWVKAEKNDDIILVAKRYNCNRNVAKQYMRLLNETDLQSLREMYDVEGSSKNKKKVKTSND